MDGTADEISLLPTGRTDCEPIGALSTPTKPSRSSLERCSELATAVVRSVASLEGVSIFSTPAAPLQRLHLRGRTPEPDLERAAGTIWPQSAPLTTGPRRPLHLLALPQEVQLLWLRCLSFADIIRLRRTCKKMREIAHPRWLSVVFGDGPMMDALLSHCKLCLSFDPTRANLLKGALLESNYPMPSVCFRCAIDNGDQQLRPGRRVLLANDRDVWVCSWCGLPVVGDSRPRAPQYHPVCLKRYNSLLCKYFSLGIVQFGLTITDMSMCVTYYRHTGTIYGLAVSCFLVSLFLYCILIKRQRYGGYWKPVLWIECIILAHWAGVVVVLTNKVSETDATRIDVVTLTACSLNILFRLLNILGNVIMGLEYEVILQPRRNLSRWRRWANLVLMGIIYWTYPAYMDGVWESSLL